MLITACIGLFFNMINMFVIECLFNPEKESKVSEVVSAEEDVLVLEDAEKPLVPKKDANENE